MLELFVKGDLPTMMVASRFYWIYLNQMIFIATKSLHVMIVERNFRTILM